MGVKKKRAAMASLGRHLFSSPKSEPVKKHCCIGRLWLQVDREACKFSIPGIASTISGTCSVARYLDTHILDGCQMKNQLSQPEPLSQVRWSRVFSGGAHEDPQRPARGPDRLQSIAPRPG